MIAKSVVFGGLRYFSQIVRPAVLTGEVPVLGCTTAFSSARLLTLLQTQDCNESGAGKTNREQE
jgi:hypothetical protein